MEGLPCFFFLQLLVQHTIPTTFNSQQNNINVIILFRYSSVQPLLLPLPPQLPPPQPWLSVMFSSPPPPKNFLQAVGFAGNNE